MILSYWFTKLGKVERYSLFGFMSKWDYRAVGRPPHTFKRKSAIKQLSWQNVKNRDL